MFFKRNDLPPLLVIRVIDAGVLNWGVGCKFVVNGWKGGERKKQSEKWMLFAAQLSVAIIIRQM
jgi:hypothetical protein